MPLFSKGSLVVLESLSFTKTLYAFDFDGTLAKIVRDPDSAKMTPTTESLLKKLADLVPVAIVSGRSVEDLRQRIPFKTRYLVGNHGIEGIHSRILASAKETCSEWIQRLKTIELDAGVEIEEKTYSLALHFRKSRHKSIAKTQINDAIGELTPRPRVITGKCVYNLLPPNAPHKGIAVLDLLKQSGLKHVFYVGDDDTDEDVFSLTYSSGQIMSVRVGKKDNSQSIYYIQRQSQINRLLRLLIRYHQPEKRS